jgi:hypothetical protein
LGPIGPVVSEEIILPLLKIENLAKNHLKVIASETAGSKGTKLW